MPAAYHDATPSRHRDGAVTLNGRWIATAQSLRPADRGSNAHKANNYVAIRYHALDANAVIKPESGKPVRVFVLQDHAPVVKADAGKDIHYDARGRSYLQVRQPRMYHLTHNAKFGSHELKLAPQSPGFSL